MKATTDNGTTLTGKTLSDIRKQLNSMLSVDGPRAITAVVTETGTIVHVELYDGQDYIKTADGRIVG